MHTCVRACIRAYVPNAMGKTRINTNGQQPTMAPVAAQATTACGESFIQAVWAPSIHKRTNDCGKRAVPAMN